jgi:hydrogenase nickel incorporation protein HypA/HybF
MHELSIIANLFEIMEKKAAEKKAKKITYVKLQVGTLSGVVPELLISAFDIYKKDTLASEAEMEIETVPLRIKCRDCGRETTKDDYILSCPACSSANLDNLAGTELILEKMELEV